MNLSFDLSQAFISCSCVITVCELLGRKYEKRDIKVARSGCSTAERNITLHTKHLFGKNEF